MELDPFRIRAHVADFEAIVVDLVARSAAARASIPMAADIAYGSHPAETLDLFFPSGPRRDLPVHLFIHGGYWRMFSKRDYSLVAETVTRAGAIAAVLDYALMPAVRMEAIVDQVRRAGRWLREHIAEYGGDPERISVSGHSAGAHLSTFLFEAAPGNCGVQAALLLGGLYELKPLQTSFLQAEIGITDQEVVDFTPMRRSHDPSTRVSILVGADETAPFHLQAHAFSERLREQGLDVMIAILSGRNHMDSVRDLGLPDSEAGDRLMQLIRTTARG